MKVTLTEMNRFTEVTLKSGKIIKVLPAEVETLRKAGRLMEENRVQPKAESIKPPVYKLPVLTSRQRNSRIRQAKKLKRKGYSIREIARRLDVSHTAVEKWFK
jgi:DNA-binding NarL/FixJ family response regulator